MGLHFGNLYKIRNIITYRISPFELKAFGGFFSHGFPNTIRRIREEFFNVVPPFLIGYLAYDQIKKRHQQLMRKNPADYENDV
ncbi:hypothetical protein WA026_009569 [Henosepilachna vigintioctopunctata]|uniref:Cytochrome b-c1 complex subunit 8 n=1 Tax=Henosepilachna vigintioctopunctata TaxID=420089 RepID=A0AAW1U6D0_9CUCU